MKWDEVERLRKEVGIPKAVFVRKIGVDYSTYSSALRRKSQGTKICSYETVAKIADVLHVDIDSIAGQVGDMGDKETVQTDELAMPLSDVYSDEGMALRKARIKKGYSLVGLASRVGVTPQALAQIESGRRKPSAGLQTLLRLFLRDYSEGCTRITTLDCFFRQLNCLNKRGMSKLAERLDELIRLPEYQEENADGSNSSREER